MLDWTSVKNKTIPKKCVNDNTDRFIDEVRDGKHNVTWLRICVTYYMLRQKVRVWLVWLPAGASSCWPASNPVNILRRRHFNKATKSRSPDGEAQQEKSQGLNLKALRWRYLASWSVMMEWGASWRLCWSHPGCLWLPPRRHRGSSLLSEYRTIEDQELRGLQRWAVDMPEK